MEYCLTVKKKSSVICNNLCIMEGCYVVCVCACAFSHVYVCLCVPECTYMCACVYLEVREQLTGVGPLLPLYEA